MATALSMWVAEWSSAAQEFWREAVVHTRCGSNLAQGRRTSWELHEQHVQYAVGGPNLSPAGCLPVSRLCTSGSSSRLSGDLLLLMLMRCMAPLQNLVSRPTKPLANRDLVMSSQ